jgi:hypothetical protein
VAQQTINSNSTQPLGGPNQGVGSDQGDTWDTAVAKLNAMFTDLYSGSGVSFPAGTGTGTYKAAGNLTVVSTEVGSSATNTTQTLTSYTLPANTLDAAGRELNITAWGHVAGNAAPKTVALNVGGAAVTTGTQTGSGYAWELTCTTLKTAANAQTNFFSGVASGGIVTQKFQTDTSVDTGTIAISVTCADASAAQSNVFLDGFTVEYFR